MVTGESGGRAIPETIFPEVTPGTFQQFASLLVERLAIAHLPEMAGMLRLRGRWTDPGRPSGRYFYAARVVDDGGAQAKIEIPASLVASRGVVPGQGVIVTGRMIVKAGNYGIEVKLSATDIQLGEMEEVNLTEAVPQGRMTMERLRALPLQRVPFPDHDVVSVTLIQSSSAAAQVGDDCMAELVMAGNRVEVAFVRGNMLDPVAIATAIRNAAQGDILIIIRGGGNAQDFEVFDDPRVVGALAGQKAHRVVGLGHTGNATLLDLVADYSANTPAQAGAYVREKIQQRLRQFADIGRDLRIARERVMTLEKERASIQDQLRTTAALLQQKARGAIPAWLVAAAFLAGAVLAWLFV